MSRDVGPSAPTRFPLGSKPWIAAFNLAEGQPLADAHANDPGASLRLRLQNAPRSARTPALRVAADERGRVAVAALSPRAKVDVIVEWSDVRELSGLRVPDAVARATFLRRAKFVRQPPEETLRLGWNRFAGYFSSDVRLPDFARFTLDA